MTLPRRPARANPLTVGDRQAMIIDAVIPLLLEHGRDVTSKQIAEAAGIAEGTIFRAFGDKESLIAAAVLRYLDPEPLRRELRAIDPGIPLEEKVHIMITLLQRRFADVLRMFAIVGPQHPHGSHGHQAYASIIASALKPDLQRLSLPPVRVAHVIRLIAFATSLPQLNEGVEFTTDELTEIVLHGIASVPMQNSPVQKSAPMQKSALPAEETQDAPVRRLPARN